MVGLQGWCRSFNITLWKEGLSCDYQQFHQYQQIEQLHVHFVPQIIEHRKDPDIYEDGNPSYDLDRHKNAAEFKLLIWCHPFPSWLLDLQWWYKDSHGLDPMVVGFTTTCTCEISAYHHLSCEFESHSDDVYLITFVSDLQ